MAQDTVFQGPHHVDPVRREYTASEAITPGEMVEFGGSNDIQKHSTAGGNARKAFALENDLIGNSISDDYSSGDTVQVGVMPRGAQVQALLPTGGTEVNISKGQALESSGDGTLQAWGTNADSGEHDNLIGYALEAVDNSGGSSEARIEIEVA